VIAQPPLFRHVPGEGRGYSAAYWKSLLNIPSTVLRTSSRVARPKPQLGIDRLVANTCVYANTLYQSGRLFNYTLHPHE
jgi:hypothetical protein